MAFACPLNKIVDFRNLSTVSLITGLDNTNITVVLACCANGSKLKLMIFKKKTMPKEVLLPEITMTVNEKKKRSG